MLTRSKLIIFIIIGVVAFLGALAAAYFLIFGGDGGENPPPAPAQKPIVLEVWGLFDDSDIYEPIFSAYTKTNPRVTLRYKKFIWDDYEPTLMDALASQRGPDIFMVHNTWLGKHSGKLSPAPSGGALDFIKEAHFDFTKGRNTYAFPLFIDNLALFYNKDIFAQEGFSDAPRNWDQFIQYAKALTRFSSDGALERSGVSLGADSGSINRATDILLFLLLQNGVEPFSKNKGAAVVTWKDNPEALKAATDALRFYTDFANPSKSFYSWNEDQEYSLDAFAEGKSAMMFNYAYQLEAIKQKAPYVNVATAPLPSKGRPVTIGNYWGFAVSNQSVNKEYAWDFLKFFSQDQQYFPYIKQTGRLSAKEGFLKSQRDDPLLKPFADQVQFMKTPSLPDEKKVQEIFDEMIQKVNSGELTHEQALRLAGDRLQLLIK